MELYLYEVLDLLLKSRNITRLLLCGTGRKVLPQKKKFSSLFTIITKHIHHRAAAQADNKKKTRQKKTIITWKYTEEKNQAFIKENKNVIHKRTYIQKKQQQQTYTIIIN